MRPLWCQCGKEKLSSKWRNSILDRPDPRCLSTLPQRDPSPAPVVWASGVKAALYILLSVVENGYPDFSHNKTLATDQTMQIVCCPFFPHFFFNQTLNWLWKKFCSMATQDDNSIRLESPIHLSQYAFIEEFSQKNGNIGYTQAEGVYLKYYVWGGKREGVIDSTKDLIEFVLESLISF